MDRSRRWPVVRALLPLLLAVVCSALLFHLQYRWDNKYTGYRPTSRDGVMWLNNTAAWGNEDLLLHLVDGWEIYQDRLLDPGELSGSFPDAYLFLGQYGGLNLSDCTRLPHGDATYHTTILTDGVSRIYALELPEIYSAYRIWINGEPMGGKGQVGEGYRPEIGGAFLTFPAEDRVELVVQVSDRDGYYSGMVYPPAFGAPVAVQRVLSARLAVHAAAWATALLLGAFCLVPWQGWKTGGRRQLLLALFCLCFVVYSGYPLTHGWGLFGNLWYGVERAARQMMTICLLLITGELCGIPRRIYRLAAVLGVLVALLMLYPQLFLGGVAWGFYFTGAVVRWWHRLAAALLMGFGAWGLWRRRVRSTGLLAAAFIFACATVMDQLYYHEPIVGGWFAETAGFLILLIVAGILRGEAKETARERMILREEAHLHGQRMELLRQKEQVQRLRVEDARAREHETKHRLLALRAQLERGDLPGLEQSISRWLGDGEAQPRVRYTGNELIDLLVAAAQDRAEALGAELEQDLLGIPPSIAMEDRDLSTILMNLLDNAPDACAGMPPGQRRWARLEMRYRQGALSILVENSYSGPRSRRRGGYRSTKAAEGHGYGLGSIGGRANDAGSLYVGDGAYLELTNRGTNVDPGDLQIGECTIDDNTGTYTGTYHWLLVEDGVIDTVATTLESFWLTDGQRQIIQAGESVMVDADPGFAQWYTSGNIPLANPGFDPTLNPVTFTMPSDNAWIAYTNLSRPLSVSPDTLSLDLDNNRTGTVTLDMGINDSDGISPAATGATAVSSDPAIAEVEYGPHTGDVTVTSKGPGDATVTFTFNDPTPTTLSVAVNVAASTTPGPSVSTTTLELAVEETDTFFVSLGEGYNGAESATITSDKPSFATVDPPSLGQSGSVRVTGVAKGSATISIGYSGGSRHGKSDTVQVTVTAPDDGGNGNGGNTGASSGSSSGGSSIPDGQRTKTTLPASALSWDGRSLTVNHDNVTTFGLLSVQWDGQPLNYGTDYRAYQGSVIVRFDPDFIAAQSPGTHTVQVEFFNHTGEATVTVGDTGLANQSDGLLDNDTQNPTTGGYPDGSYPGATDNPNTGGGRGIWPTLLLSSLGGVALVLAEKDTVLFRRNQQ